MNDKLLIIFTKNPVLGQIKTRLAASIGKEAALEVYQELLAYTRLLTEALPFDKAIFYSSHIDKYDDWDPQTYQKYKQAGDNLGERMQNAFQIGFASGYKSICLIGSDCHQLTSVILNKAFGELQTHPMVIGPSLDGGYYLLGMNQLEARVFQKKKWSTNTVFSDTVADLKLLNIAYGVLPQLRDVDRAEDLVTMPSWSEKENLF